MLNPIVKAMSHTRLRALLHFDYYTSSTLIGGEAGARPSLLHTTLEGLMELWLETPNYTSNPKLG